MAELARLLGEVSRTLAAAGQAGGQSTGDAKAPPAPLAPGCKKLTVEDVDMQQAIFKHFDTDNTGQLAQVETVRMMRAMQLFDTTEELVEVIKQMDEDNSGTIDFDEYIEYIDDKCQVDDEFYVQYHNRSRSTKLGYDGTTWRKHANVAWLTSQGVLILTALAILGALIYFRFILVPMTMAYFLTFLLGPVQDLLIQRPLVCCNMVCCDKPGIRPALRQHVNCCGKEMRWYQDEDETVANYKTPQERWAGMHKDTGEWDGTRMVMRWEDAGTGCCYAIPPPQWSEEPTQGGGPIKNMIWEFFVVMKIPEVLSVVVTFILTGTLLVLTFLVISAEIVSQSLHSPPICRLQIVKCVLPVRFGHCLLQVEVLDDPTFQNAKDNAVVELNSYLASEHHIGVAELLEVNSTVDDEIEVYDSSTLETVAGPYLLVVNDAVTTLLLCMYMLSTRQPESEEETYKEVQGMTLFEKIKSKVKFYVVLKTALSALTGGLVGAILLACRVRLAMLFALLAFILNFIPNVGSMIATVLPIPLILLDEVEDDFAGRKALAILLPAIVQGYVGNVLEPTVFGKSLNVTAISVLVALVLWGSIWGIQGAILSVPLLAAMKVALEDTDHPMAKMVLRIVRESASIDDGVEANKSRRQKRKEEAEAHERLKLLAAARFEGLLDHDVEHGQKLQDVQIVHRHQSPIADVAAETE
jgi:predicted PurR-regulated permease PerM